MHTLKKITLLGFLLLTFNSRVFAAEPCNPQPFAQCDAHCISELQQKLDNFRTQNNIPGMQMTVGTSHQQLQTFCSGTKTRGGATPIEKNSLFLANSLTKSFTAAIILQLEAEGKLKITDKIGKYFPEYSGWQDVTIKQLLNMTSGIPSYDIKDKIAADRSRFWEMDELTNLVYASSSTPVFTPGSNWMYADAPYTLAGLLIEKITKRSVEENFKERIFAPDRLLNSIYNNNLIPSTSPLTATRMAHGYCDYQCKPFAIGDDLTDINTSSDNTGGGLITNSEDLAKWGRALFTMKQVLLPQQFREMTSLVCPGPIAGNTCVAGTSLADDTDQYAYSLGWFKIPKDFRQGIGKDIWFYDPAGDGYRAWFAYVPDDEFIITITSNAFNLAPGSDFILEVYKKLYPNMDFRS